MSKGPEQVTRNDIFWDQLAIVLEQADRKRVATLRRRIARYEEWLGKGAVLAPTGRKRKAPHGNP